MRSNLTLVRLRSKKMYLQKNQLKKTKRKDTFWNWLLLNDVHDEVDDDDERVPEFVSCI